MEKVKQIVIATIHGIVGFIVLGSMVLAGFWIRERLQPKSTTIIELSADDILERLAQSSNYEIQCDKNGGGRIAFHK